MAPSAKQQKREARKQKREEQKQQFAAKSKGVSAPPSPTIVAPPASPKPIVPAIPSPTAPVVQTGAKAVVAPPPIAPPPAPAAPPVPTAPVLQKVGDTLTGTVVAVTYDRNRKKVYCRIKSGDKTYTCHHSSGVVPNEGEVVKFTTYTHEGQIVAKFIAAIGNDDLATDRFNELRKLPVYKFMRMEDWLGSQSPDTVNPSIVGTTVEGMILVYSEDERG